MQIDQYVRDEPHKVTAKNVLATPEVLNELADVRQPLGKWLGECDRLAPIALFLNPLFLGLDESIELVSGRHPLVQDPLAHLAQAVVLFLPGEPILGFVALVRARGRVPEWLRELRDVQDGGAVIAPHDFQRSVIRRAQSGVVPSRNGADLDLGTAPSCS